MMRREEAYDVLGVPAGSGMNQIVERYKYLGKQYHPQIAGDDEETLQKFTELNIAFATLKSSGRQVTVMSMEQMLRQFQEVFFQRILDNSTSSSSEEEDSDNDDDNARSDDQNSEAVLLDHGTVFIPSDGITDEERERKRAEKRRLKKKRQKERKKQEKRNNKHQPQVEDTAESTSPEIRKKKSDSRSSDSALGEDGEFDPNAAFFTEVKKKKSKQTDAPKKEKKEKAVVAPNPLQEEGTEPCGMQNGSASPHCLLQHSPRMLPHVQVDETEPRVLRSRQLAVRGNEMAKVQEYNAAIELFSEAINLDPRDFRFFGNRSFCFERIQQYEKALKDAEKAIELNPSWAKGYFRQGRALTGLKHYTDAEKSFSEVLKLDPQCSDANQELFNVQVCRLMDMGFTRQESEKAIQEHQTVEDALDFLLSSRTGDLLLGNGNESDEDEFQVQYSKHTLQQHQKQQAAADVKMNPSNPEGLTALWVGNVLPQVSEKKLMTMFQKYGKVTSVRMLHEKYCAFINFETKESAGLAMQKLQGVECEGQHLLIKFPDNPIIANGHITLRKPTATKQQGQDNGLRKRGPVNGDECYFWRTTGCSFGSACRHKHIPEHKEIDKKSWQKA